MNEDKVLMTSFLAGDQDSFEKLIIKYRLPAINFARKYLNDGHMAEDMVQESFADLFVYKERYDRNFSFKTYLFCIIKNKCCSYLRKKKGLLLDDIDICSDQTPEMIVLTQERRNLVRRKINELKADYRIAIYLSEFECFSYEEIAKIMGKNLGQVKILIYRARKKLKTLLEKEA